MESRILGAYTNFRIFVESWVLLEISFYEVVCK
jgi:hypothetical protein